MRAVSKMYTCTPMVCTICHFIRSEEESGFRLVITETAAILSVNCMVKIPEH